MRSSLICMFASYLRPHICPGAPAPVQFPTAAMQPESSRKLNARSSPAHFRRRLLQWYDANKRDLPWRKNTNPYNVWLSEIMLQQTRVAAVIDHYQRFLTRFSTVEKLAKAREASVLAAWSGLGYYRRARMLHAAAKKIVREHESNFPATPPSFSTCPALDDTQPPPSPAFPSRNQSRSWMATWSVCWEEFPANISVAKKCGSSPDNCWMQSPRRFQPGDDGIGRDGLPSAPTLCSACPVRHFCGRAARLRRREKPSRQTKRTTIYTLDIRDGSVFLVQRAPAASLMAGMWELPELTDAVAEKNSVPYMMLRHSITVTDYTVQVVRQPAPQGASGKWVPASRAGTLPLTGLARKILRKAGII